VKNLLSFRASRSTSAGRPRSSRCSTPPSCCYENQLMAHRVEARIEVEPDLPMPDIEPNQDPAVSSISINNGRPGDRLDRTARYNRGPGPALVGWGAIDVIDDGPGCPRPGFPVFEPFFTTKPEGEGTGSASPSARASCGSTGAVSCSPRKRAKAPVHRAASPRHPACRPRRLRERCSDETTSVWSSRRASHLHYMRATLEAWGTYRSWPGR